jgi:hypothetical protein
MLSATGLSMLLQSSFQVYARKKKLPPRGGLLGPYRIVSHRGPAATYVYVSMFSWTFMGQASSSPSRYTTRLRTLLVWFILINERCWFHNLSTKIPQKAAHVFKHVSNPCESKGWKNFHQSLLPIFIAYVGKKQRL